MDKGVQVKLTGGRQGKERTELFFFYMILALRFWCLLVSSCVCFFLLFAVTGTLKGYDQLLNLVLDGAVGSVRGISLLLHHRYVYEKRGPCSLSLNHVCYDIIGTLLYSCWGQKLCCLVVGLHDLYSTILVLCLYFICSLKVI